MAGSSFTPAARIFYAPSSRCVYRLRGVELLQRLMSGVDSQVFFVLINEARILLKFGVA